ncbi:MAG: CPBP family intramembrane glutamic endopeptidase [Clostridium sp.]
MFQRLWSNRIWQAFYPFLLYEITVECIYTVVPEVGMVPATAMGAVFAIILFYRRYKRDAENELPIQRFTPYSAVLTALSGICFCVAGSCFFYIISCYAGGSCYEAYSEPMAQTGFSTGIMILCIGIIIPAAEEFVFRAMMFLRLRQYLKPSIAAIISAAVFGLYHGNLYQGIYAGVMGLLLSWLLQRYNDIKAPLIFHMVANLTALVINITPLSKQLGKDETALWLITAFAVVGFGICGYLILRKRNKGETKRDGSRISQ